MSCKVRNLRGGQSNARTEMETEIARNHMVDQQIRSWTVLNHEVLDVMRTLPRDRFVPARYRGLAFADIEIPLGHGQNMMKPRIEGRLLQALNITPHDEVLEVGTGSGYLTACLASLSRQVTSIDLYPDFIDNAATSLDAAGIGNCDLSAGDVYDLAPKQAYDVIAVTGSIPEFDTRFQEWLAPGGRLWVVAGQAPVMQAMLVQRTGAGEWVRRSLFETLLTPLTNAPLLEQFIL